jgi:hypothetical protein
VRLTKLALGSALAIAFALGVVSSARGQGADIRIAELKCTGDPEVVVIENAGDTAETLTGWQLQSDPTDSEVFDLGVLGGLQPGALVNIQSGPSASGVFNWGMEYIFRDNDPTDFARIVDSTGTVVDQVNCASEATPEASPTASPQPSPSPTPTPPPGDVPNGGGPPPPSGETLLASLLVLVGGGMAAAGMATGAFSGLRLLSSPAPSGTAASPRESEARPRRMEDARGERAPAALGLALVGIVAAALVFRLFRRRSP